MLNWQKLPLNTENGPFGPGLEHFLVPLHGFCAKSRSEASLQRRTLPGPRRARQRKWSLVGGDG